MQSGTKHSFLRVFVCFIIAIWMTGCTASSHLNEGPRYCGPHSIVFSTAGTAYLLGYSQLLAISSQGNIINNETVPNFYGQTSDMLDISNNGNIWEVTNDSGNNPTILTIYNSQGYFVTQMATDFHLLNSVKVSPSTDIGWIGGQNYIGTGVITSELKVLNINGQSLTSFTLPEITTSNDGWFGWLSTVKLAISFSNGTIWAWSPGYLSGYSFTGLVYGPYPVNLSESSDYSNQEQIGCGVNEKWIIVNPVSNDIWMGNPATTTILALSPDGTVRFQKNLDINISTMAVSPKTGNVWIGSNNRIVVLDPYGNIIKQLTFNNLNCITYMAISPVDNTVWVGNETNISNTEKNIIILDDNGNIVNSIYVPVRCAYPLM